MPAINLSPKQLRVISNQVDLINGLAIIGETGTPPIDNVRVAEGVNGHAFTLYAGGIIVAVHQLDGENIKSAEVFV